MTPNEQSPEPLPIRTDPREQWLMNDLEKHSAIGEIGDRAISLFRFKARHYLAAAALVIGGGLIVKEIINEDTAQKPSNVTVEDNNVATEAPDPCVVKMGQELDAGRPVEEALPDYELCQQQGANGSQFINLGK